MIYLDKRILKEPLEREGFYYLNNPTIINGEQIINEFQSNILSKVGGGIKREELISKTNSSPIKVDKAISILQRKGFLSTSNELFTEPAPRDSNASLSLWVHTSNKCNLACAYCYVTAEKDGKLMSDKTLDTVIENAIQTVKQNKIKKLRLKFAGGEPLLTFRMWSSRMNSLKDELDRIGSKLDIQIITNGTILSDSIIEFIKEYNVGVGLSLDGFGFYQDESRFFHNGKGSFDKVYQNLCKMKSVGIDPYITTVVTAKNLPGLEAITSFFVEENLRFRFSIEKYDFPDLSLLIPALKKSYQIIQDNINIYDRFLSHKLCDLSFDRPIVDTPCGVGASHASVNHNGNLHTCQTEQFEPEIGSVFQSKNLLHLIRNQDNVDKLSAIAESCKVCKYKYNCAGGCPVNKVQNKSPFCHLFHEVFPVILKLRGTTILNKHIGVYG